MDIQPQESGKLGELAKALDNLEPIEFTFDEIKMVKIQLHATNGITYQAYIVRKQDEKGMTRFFFTGTDKVIVFDRTPEIWEKELKHWQWDFVLVKVKK